MGRTDRQFSAPQLTILYADYVIKTQADIAKRKEIAERINDKHESVRVSQATSLITHKVNDDRYGSMIVAAHETQK